MLWGALGAGSYANGRAGGVQQPRPSRVESSRKFQHAARPRAAFGLAGRGRARYYYQLVEMRRQNEETKVAEGASKTMTEMDRAGRYL